MEKSVVEKSRVVKECLGEVLWRSRVGESVGEKCCGEALWRSVVKRCCGEVL